MVLHQFLSEMMLLAVRHHDIQNEFIIFTDFIRCHFVSIAVIIMLSSTLHSHLLQNIYIHIRYRTLRSFRTMNNQIEYRIHTQTDMARQKASLTIINHSEYIRRIYALYYTIDMIWIRHDIW